MATRPRKVKSFWTLDCETDPFSVQRNINNEIPQPFKWGAYHIATDTYEEFDTGAQVVEFFRDKKGLVYAHNGGKFDYHYLRDFINSDDPILVISGRLARFKIGECEFRDSLNLLPVPLDTFGGKTEIDYAKFEPGIRDAPRVMGEIRAYLKQDCVTLAEQLHRYFEEYGKSLTQAGASMKYWEKHFGIDAPRQSKSDFERYRPYYYGGRVQCFDDGSHTANFSVMDINSAYPNAMMQKHAFSTCAIQRRHLPPGDQLYKCLIKLTCAARGVFPWRDEEGALYFPDDEGGKRKRQREYYVTGWEFLTALASDNISYVNLKEIHYFPETVSFQNYIEHFYAKRMLAKSAHDKAGDVFCKLFMNSLYGKFGQDCDNHSEYVIASDDSLSNWIAKGYAKYKPWGDRYLLTRKNATLSDDSPKRRYYNIATAASITGFVRAQLYRALDSCSGLIYCDTDSIAAKNTDSLRVSDTLGDWKKEMPGDFYAVAGKKLYAFRNAETGLYKTACKGVDLSAEQIIRVANGETIEYVPEVPCYSLTRSVPRYINRNVMRTFRDISCVN